jgi:hypothetical protein
MTNTPDEAKLKELIKSAMAEALDERESIKVGREMPSVHSKSPLKVILLWVLILVVAVGLWNFVEHASGQ